ncbi:translation initiation factor 4E [Pancytospora philotis]|nr:translation initiation factor 4E [Pancytospora philotis]
MESGWCYYQLSNNSEQTVKSWADSLKRVGEVRTVPELLYTLDEIEQKGFENLIDLNFFKGSVKPMWEDPANINGGRCILEVPLTMREAVPDIWRSTVALCVSHLFDTINGCVFNEKSCFRIALWISDPAEAEATIKAWRELIPAGYTSLNFSLHNKYGDHSKGKKRFSFRNRQN